MKKKVILSSVVILLISSLLHSVYDKFPCFFTSLFLPVNESIWEHNKMILMSYLIFMFIYFIIKKEKENIMFASLMSSICCIILVNIIFTPIYLYLLKTNDVMFITLSIYAVSILVSQLLFFKLLNCKNSKFNNFYGLIGFVILIMLFAYLTYNPLEFSIFYDFTKHKYGI